ncbi:MAG: PQQ-binding-like beta-propeller repeat protein [Planctomycetes bacterium]|jgi:serine/threonine-protein kinase|nr:PQQ-binding-like beta-propeller repeat protein [Planctomycetota bacterium]
MHILTSSLLSTFLPWCAVAQQVPPPASAQTPAEAPTATAAPQVLWRSMSNERSDIDSVVHLGGTLYLLDRTGQVRALDAATGEVRWTQAKADLPCKFTFGLTTVAVEAEVFVVVGCDAGLRAFRGRDGEPLWQTDIPGGVAGPTVAKGIVVAGGARGRVHGCDLQTGAIRWDSDYLEDRPEDPPGFVGRDARFAEPARPCDAATDGEIVALSVFDQCRTLAFEPVTGKRLWSFPTQGWMFGTPAFGPLFVYVGSQDCGIYAIDKQTGKQVWRVATDNRTESAPAIAERFLYQGSCDGNLRAIDVAVERVAWTFTAPVPAKATRAIYSRPVVVGDLVCFAMMEGTVYGIDRAKGTERWRLRPCDGSHIAADLGCDGERLFVVVGSTMKGGQDGVVAIALR